MYPREIPWCISSRYPQCLFLFVLSRRVVHDLSDWDYRQIVAGSVWVGVFIQSFKFRQLSDQTVQRIWALGFGYRFLAHTQSDLSIAQPLACTGRDVYLCLRIFG